MKHAPLCVLSFLLLAAACGDKGGGVNMAGDLGGPPAWRLASSALATGGTGFTLQARTPGRVRFRVEATGHLERTSPWRDLAGGQTITIAWSQRQEPAAGVTDVPTPEDERAGRTEAHSAIVRFELSDRILGGERFVFFARPGKGRVLSRDLLPPGKYEPLSLSGPIELCTLVVSDLAAGEVVLRTRDLAGRIVRPQGMTAADRVHEVRLFLEVELVGE